MARGNKKGPLNRGPRTGRGMGFCAGYDTPGYMNPGFGQGRGFGFGGGFGWRGGRGGGGFGHRHWYHATGLTGWQRAAMGASPRGPGWDPEAMEEDELEFIEAQAEQYREELDELRRRVDVLKKKNKRAEQDKT